MEADHDAEVDGVDTERLCDRPEYGNHEQQRGGRVEQHTDEQQQDVHKQQENDFVVYIGHAEIGQCLCHAESRDRPCHCRGYRNDEQHVCRGLGRTDAGTAEGLYAEVLLAGSDDGGVYDRYGAGLGSGADAEGNSTHDDYGQEQSRQSLPCGMAYLFPGRSGLPAGILALHGYPVAEYHVGNAEQDTGDRTGKEHLADGYSADTAGIYYHNVGRRNYRPYNSRCSSHAA